MSAVCFIYTHYYCYNRRRQRYREGYRLSNRSMRTVDGEGSEARTDPAADGKSASSIYDQQEPWASNPEVQMNELAKPRYKSQLHRSVLIPYWAILDSLDTLLLKYKRNMMRSECWSVAWGEMECPLVAIWWLRFYVKASCCKWFRCLWNILVLDHILQREKQKKFRCDNILVLSLVEHEWHLWQ